MSRYAVNSLLYRLKKDPEFRALFIKDPGATIGDLDLTDAERAAFVARDLRKVNELGGYLHLVISIPSLAALGRPPCSGAIPPIAERSIFQRSSAWLSDLPGDWNPCLVTVAFSPNFPTASRVGRLERK